MSGISTQGSDCLGIRKEMFRSERYHLCSEEAASGYAPLFFCELCLRMPSERTDAEWRNKQPTFPIGRLFDPPLQPTRPTLHQLSHSKILLARGDVPDTH